MPGDANVTLPLFSFANAMNSLTDRAGEDAGTTMKNEKPQTSETGAKSATAS